MPKCPHCGSEIEYLRDFSPSWEEFRFSLDEGGEVYESQDNICPMDSVDDEFECPECNHILFADLQEAIDFLKKGGKPWVLTFISDGPK